MTSKQAASKLESAANLLSSIAFHQAEALRAAALMGYGRGSRVRSIADELYTIRAGLLALNTAEGDAMAFDVGYARLEALETV